MTSQSPTPLPDARLKEWRKLQQSKYRKKTGLFVAEGARCVEQILAGGRIRIEALIIGEGAGSMSSWVPPARLFSATSSQIAALSATESPQPIIAICAIPDQPDLIDLAKAAPVESATPSESAPSADTGADGLPSATGFATLPVSTKTGLLLGLDALQDPGNLGTIIRTAAWFGVQGILSGSGTVDTWNPKTVRSAAGAIGAMPVLDVALPGAMTQLKEAGWTLLGLDLAPESMSLGAFTAAWRATPKPILLIVGNEANGISSEVRRHLDATIFIHGARDAVESLNASVSTGIALYELTRDA
jgi:TrmH family RNA methyltransferase